MSWTAQFSKRPSVSLCAKRQQKGSAMEQKTISTETLSPLQSTPSAELSVPNEQALREKLRLTEKALQNMQLCFRQNIRTIIGEKELAGSAMCAEAARWTIKAAAQSVATLTPRQHEIMEMVLAGQPSKNIAADLSISQRTVETHRAAIMEKTGAQSIAELARTALATAWAGADEPLPQCVNCALRTEGKVTTASICPNEIRSN
jgi:DNA-binding CsgD family transcriptional regulator